MNELLVAVTALAVSIALIPAMMRVAPRLGMIDVPDPRKVHARPVPRVGGIGIALGALAAILVIGPDGAWLKYYVSGALTLLVFGALDDSREMGHYTKFIGQFLAVVPLVWFGDVWVSSFPFLSSPLPESVGKPFTVFAIIGVINAVNHSDGLDGLAAGETVLSLGCCAYLAWVAGSPSLVVVCLAVLGGLFGFLRFNTHPARVFMGDAGSQFLGFTLGAVAVGLTQQAYTSVSMALPLLMLGLPVIDILAVFYLRISGGMHWFRATRNHIHHRLLNLGFAQDQAVVLLYAVQAFFVVCAVAFRHESDALVLSLYAVPCALLFGLLCIAERAGWRARRAGPGDGPLRAAARTTAIGQRSIALVACVVPLYLAGGALWLPRFSGELETALMAGLAALAPAVALHRHPWARTLAKAAVYALVPLWVYALDRAAAVSSTGLLAAANVLYGLLAASVALAWKFARDQDFALTTMDFLIALAAVAASLLAGDLGGSAPSAGLMVKVIIVLYACELVFTRAGRRAREALPIVALASVLYALVAGSGMSFA